jgi:hypothetical protein
LTVVVVCVTAPAAALDRIKAEAKERVKDPFIEIPQAI